MTLDAIDWHALTHRQAVSLRNAARRREKAVGRRFEAGEATDEEFTAAMLLEENLHIFVLTGLRPDQHD